MSLSTLHVHVQSFELEKRGKILDCWLIQRCQHIRFSHGVDDFGPLVTAAFFLLTFSFGLFLVRPPPPPQLLDLTVPKKSFLFFFSLVAV